MNYIGSELQYHIFPPVLHISNPIGFSCIALTGFEVGIQFFSPKSDAAEALMNVPRY